MLRLDNSIIVKLNSKEIKSMPRYSVMTFRYKHWITKDKMSLPAMFKGFAEAGVQGVEPFHVDFVADAPFAKTYRQAAQDQGL